MEIINLHARTNFPSHGKLAPQKIPHIEDQLISDGSLILGDNESPGYQTIIIYFIIINNSGHTTNTEHKFDCSRDYDII